MASLAAVAGLLALSPAVQAGRAFAADGGVRIMTKAAAPTGETPRTVALAF